MNDQEKKDIKLIIKNTITDLVSQFLYYDRKEDEDLRVGDIEKALIDNIITITEIGELFQNELRHNL